MGTRSAELTLDEQTKKSLTEYEEHRLLENVRVGQAHPGAGGGVRLLRFRRAPSRVHGRTSAKPGEVISTLPALGNSGGNGIAFRLLYGSILDEARSGNRAGCEA